MTVRKIIADYLKQNGYDGLHSHASNNKYGGCGCNINKALLCGEACAFCVPAYAHTLEECKKCHDFKKCEAFEYGEKFMYCGKKRA